MRNISVLLILLLVSSCGMDSKQSDDTTPDSSNTIVSPGSGISTDLDSSGDSKTGDTSLITPEFITKHFSGSLLGEVSIVDCTLSAGTQTQCYTFTVAPDATIDHEIGPWCPTNISDTDIAGGIWPDDGKIYQVSGEFIENLAVFYDDDTWQLYNTETGEINVTDTKISCEGAAKPDVEEEYKNHCVECKLSYMEEVPNRTYTIPISPVVSNTPQPINNTQGTGVAFNGVTFDASAPTHAILAANTIAPFDDCGGHINLHVGYHYHETTGCSKQVEIIENHEPMIGIALDGYPMLLQASDEDKEELDSCGGHVVDGEYHYHVGETGSNQFLGCYSAEYGCASDDEDALCNANASIQRGPPPRG